MLIPKIGALAAGAVAPDERLEHPCEQRRPSRGRMQDVCAPVGQPHLEQRARRRVGDRVADALEHPAVIEQHERQLHPGATGNLARRIHVGKEVRIEPGGHAAVVIDDPGAAIGEHEPAGDAEPHRRHVAEIPLDRSPARRDTQVGAPHVRAEIETVIDGRAVGRPGIVAAVPEQG